MLETLFTAFLYTTGFQLIHLNFLFWPQNKTAFILDMLPSDQYHLCVFDAEPMHA